MRITQGYVSKSVMSFPFHQIYALDDYNNIDAPSVFFGAYRYEDNILIHHHENKATVFWTGQDAIDNHIFAFGPRNVTAHPKIYELIKSKGYACELVKPAAFMNEVNPQVLGPKIYAYCPNSAPDYHGKKVLDELRCGGYEITIGDGSIPPDLWRYSQGAYYDDIFVGLCLSSFAGGGGSIIEMGLRGIPVITNVFNLPNCHPWQDAQDVAGIIERLKAGIGTVNTGLANLVWGELDHTHEWLNI